MRRVTSSAVVMAILLFAPTVARAGPWAPEAGHGYAKLWLKYLFGFQYNAGNGQSYDYPVYQELFLAAYAEVGLVDRLALVFHSDVVRTFHLEDLRTGRIESHVAPGDPALSLRYQFLAIDRVVAAAEVGVRAPFAPRGPVQTVHTRAEGHAPIGELQLGAGVWDVPLSAGIGYSWDAYYVAASVGYVLRTDGYDHVLTWTAEGGTTLARQWGLRVRVVGWHALDVWFGERAPGHESPSGIGNGTTYLGFAVEGDYQFEPNWFLGLTLEGGAGILSRQTGGPVISVYVANRF